MRGQILVFSEAKETGAIVTEDGQRFLFHTSEWQDLLPPERGMMVSFTLDADKRTRQVQLSLPDLPSPAVSEGHSTRAAAGTAAGHTATAAPPFALRPKRKPVITLLALFLGFFGAHRFYMGAWGWGLVQLLAVPMVLGILLALLPPLGGLMYLAAFGLILTETIRYIWMSDAEFDAKVRTYQASQPGPFSFFW